MAWPTIFANLAGGNQPLALFDAMFTQVAQMLAVPCNPAGTNALTLSPLGSAPSFTSYQNFTGARFVAGATTTGPVTAQFGALASLNVYLADGVTQASTGAILINQEYVLIFVQSLNAGAGGFILESAAVAAGVTIFAPNIQVFTSGTALTYTTPTAAARLPLYLRVRMVAGGGGGGAANTNNGSAGTDSSFGGWTAIHGAGGGFAQNTGGLGGTGGINGSGTLIRRINGANGTRGDSTASQGYGGASALGGAGINTSNSGAGAAASPNSGSGGAGAQGQSSSGGAAGEYVEFIIPTPAASYTYTVGAAGLGGAAGGTAGGNGAAGRIEVEAFWQ